MLVILILKNTYFDFFTEKLTHLNNQNQLYQKQNRRKRKNADIINGHVMKSYFAAQKIFKKAKNKREQSEDV